MTSSSDQFPPFATSSLIPPTLCHGPMVESLLTLGPSQCQDSIPHHHHPHYHLPPKMGDGDQSPDQSKSGPQSHNLTPATIGIIPHPHIIASLVLPLPLPMLSH